jgi:ADP-heptose:LPS heptosyltransferase
MSELAKHGLRLKKNSSGEPILEDIIPFNPGAALHQASTLCLQGNPLQAIPIFERVMEYPQCRKVAIINLANAYMELMQLDKAVELAHEFLEYEKHDIFAYHTLVKIYIRMGEIQAAERCLIIAQALESNHNMNAILQAELYAYKNKFQEYHSAFAKSRTTSRLYIGNQPFSFECVHLFDNQKIPPEDHADIFGNHTHYVENPVFIKPYDQFKQIGYDYLEYREKAWEGEDLNGKTILVYSEQGLGDNIWLFGFIKKLKAKYNCKIHLSTYDQIHCIAKKCEYIDKVLLTVFELDDLAEADYVCNIFKLPQFLPVEYDGPYLPQFTHKKLPEGKKKVLVNWVSKPNLATVKPFSLELFSEILNRYKETHSFYICQRNLEEDRIKAEIIKYSLPVDVVSSATIDDLFSYIWDADLVLTTDTLHVHAAGGMGKETILMLSYNVTLPAWGKDIERVPAYPTVKLIRDLKNVHI